MNRGIDYGMGRTNIDVQTGIRYGVIHSHAVGESWYEQSEPNYGEPSCPSCGNEVEPTDGEKDFYCAGCKTYLWSDAAYADEPQAIEYNRDGYAASQDSYGDIFIVKSPFYTRAQFCSPCAPGACHLENPCDDGERAYCFGHDWFDGDVAPYPVFRVSDNSRVEPEVK